LTHRRERALAEIREARRRASNFSGWSFKDVRAKHLDPRIPWDYEALARERATNARAVLDLGTGGGEVLERVSDGLGCRATATEEWRVNAPIAARRLHGRADVVRASSLQLPFAGGSFDLVLDRHEALEPAEVGRVLAANGTVITQQVGPDSWPELRRFFPRKTHFGDHFGEYQRGFEAAGLNVSERCWHEERVAFGSLMDVVYMLLVAPWTIPDFDPERELDALLALEDACASTDGIVLTEHHYLIVAQR
jgi:SAM-dependent methyltransferase